MSDLKAALTEALREALDGYEDIFAAYQNADSIADVLLALPGVAVIQLPEPDYTDEPEDGEVGHGFRAGTNGNAYEKSMLFTLIGRRWMEAGNGSPERSEDVGLPALLLWHPSWSQS